MEKFVKALAEQLLKNGDLTSSDVNSFIKEFSNRSKEAVDDFLLSEGLVEKPDLLRALSQIYNLPYFDVVGYFFDTDLLHIFPKDFLITNSIIPIELDQDTLTVVASYPEDPTLRESIGQYSNSVVEFRVGLKRDIIDAVREYYETSLLEDEMEALNPEEENIEKDLQKEVNDILLEE